ncbi:SDR family oxidoreductase [Phenylobacterium sp.]|uniref:SDR family oxidoreductase n=1 Tax=Phenylobacterium sp. TaxID=1871053 RepID=UPI00301E261F
MSTFRDGLLAGKTAFVAGGTSGINLGIAIRFAQLGARVAVVGRDPAKSQAAAASIGSHALGLAADVRDCAAIRSALEQAAGELGPLDIVVSGAAGNFVAPALRMSANGFRTVIDIDLNGTFNVFRGCHDLLVRPGASLIAISAGQAVNPITMQAHVCAAKAGINQLVRVLAMEWGPDIRVNGISPGPIGGTEGMSRLAPGAPPDGGIQEWIALKRWGRIEEVAESAVFLSSPAASYVTGIILDCDGGSQLGDATRRDPTQGVKS